MEDQNNSNFLFFPNRVCLKAHIKYMSKKIYCIQANTKLATHQVKQKATNCDKAQIWEVQVFWHILPKIPMFLS